MRSPGDAPFANDGVHPRPAGHALADRHEATSGTVVLTGLQAITKAAYKKVLEEPYAQLPTYAYAKTEEYSIWTPRIHGVTGTMKSTVLFDKAWIEK